MPKMNVHTGDKVQVISGKDKRKQGTVKRAYPAESKVIVEGVALVKKAQKPTREGEQGGFVTKEAKIHVSNVMLVCPSCDKPTRVGHRFNEEGKKERFCKKCGAAF